MCVKSYVQTQCCLTIDTESILCNLLQPPTDSKTKGKGTGGEMRTGRGEGEGKKKRPVCAVHLAHLSHSVVAQGEGNVERVSFLQKRNRHQTLMRGAL